MTQSCNPGTCCASLEDLLDPALFKALSDANRLTLLATLARCARPCTVSELACCCPIDLSVVSRHLTALRRAGVVAADRRGRQVYYRVRTTALVQGLRDLADALEACASATPPAPHQPDQNPEEPTP